MVRILLVLILISNAVRGQGIYPADLYYREDSFNVRIHISYLMEYMTMGNCQSGGGYDHDIRKWDTARQQYISRIPGMLQYTAIEGSGYSKITGVSVPCDLMNNSLILNDSLPGALVAMFDRILNTAESKEPFSAVYDRTGYLQEFIKKKTDKARHYYIIDTTSYSYKGRYDQKKEN